jgi:gluconate 2-dehydrogenase gamma chain
MDAKVSRRALFSASALIGTVALETIGARAATISGEVPWTAGQADAPAPISPGPDQFFSNDEAAFIDAAVSRLIPQDRLGPGAKEVGVTVFLDRQLAGAYGRAQRWYMAGPWAKGTETQGYQSRMTPAQLYRTAIKAIAAYCQKTFEKNFAQLSPDDQDKVLGALEEGTITLDQVDAKTFFKQFLLNTQEGFFSDPLYGGNKDMAAWKMIGFLGARYDYRDFVAKHGERFPLPAVSLRGRPAWNPNT